LCIFVVRLLLKYDEKQAQSAIQNNNDIHYILWVYIYAIKENVWKEEYPFERKRKI